MKERIVYNKKGEKEYVRFGLNFRLQHIILMISTILLIVTGLPLKFFNTGWAKFIMKLFGGAEGAREFHHLAALGLIFVGIFHLGYIAVSRTGRSDFKQMIPTKKDILDFWNQLKYFFGMSKIKSKFGRFSFIEKFDYWAVYWGFVIMIGTGLVMWLFQGKLNPWAFGEIDLSLFPLRVDNYVHAISREAHSDEALLATLAIIVWHFYNVHFNPDKFPGNKVWITGTMSKEEMESEHPLELEEIEKASIKNQQPDEKEESARDNIPVDENGDEENYDEVIPEKQPKEFVSEKDKTENDPDPADEEPAEEDSSIPLKEDNISDKEDLENSNPEKKK